MEIFKEGAQINLDDEDNIFINTYDGELIDNPGIGKLLETYRQDIETE